MKASPEALYSNEAEALNAPGDIYKHYKGGVYRRHFTVTAATDTPIQNGDELVLYEHIHPNEHGFFVRLPSEWNEQVNKPELDFSGTRFEYVKTDYNISQPELISCDCHSPDHMFTFSYDADDDPMWRAAYLSIHLKSGNFGERFIRALKYLFGYKSHYGDFDEVILGERQLVRLKALVDNALATIVGVKTSSNS